MSSSFRDYGEIEEAQQARLEARRRTRKRIIIITLSAIILVGVVIVTVLGTSHGGSNSGDGSRNYQATISSTIKAVCKLTLYPDSCFSSLSSVSNSTQLSPLQPFQLSLRVVLNEISSAFVHLTGVEFKGVIGKMSGPAFSDCKELLGLARDSVNETLLSDDLSSVDLVDDLKTWLSATGTYLQTCIDGFQNDTKAQMLLYNSLKNSTEFTSNSLALLTAISDIATSFKLRRLMGLPGNEFPVWLSLKDRKLLANSGPRNIADIVVAQDGSGMYKKIADALAAVPDNSNKRVVIYVKKGLYEENVRVEKSKWNVLMVGDGMDATIVTGSKNFVDGTPTFSTATFAAIGKGFIARDMQFRNTAGAVKQQAVALRSDSDQSAFYRCRFDAFQDTLYTLANRQFYRECDILGTVDFIFGNAAAVLQSCTISPKVPIPGQQNTITAQGKIDPNQNTGISIHNCVISADGDLSSVRTYLGRPWKAYSTTVYMKSTLGSLIDPAGWLEWVGSPAPDTIFYAEFQNDGPGSSTQNRVKWKGVRTITSKQASKFTVKSFIGGDKWISNAGFTFQSDL